MNSTKSKTDSRLTQSRKNDETDEKFENFFHDHTFETDVYFENTKTTFSMKPDIVKAQGGLHPKRKKFTLGLTRLELSRSGFYVAYDLHRVSFHFHLNDDELDCNHLFSFLLSID